MTGNKDFEGFVQTYIKAVEPNIYKLDPSQVRNQENGYSGEYSDEGYADEYEADDDPPEGADDSSKVAAIRCPRQKWSTSATYVQY